jgi:hypothetical protein
MKIKRMVKRLFAVGTGVVMLGATAMGAMAADLSNYPDMFVSDGVFDGYLVVGENAASVDNLAMTDIAASMKYTAADGSSTTTVEGDAWMVGTSSDDFEINETINDVQSYIGEDELGALAGGSITNEKGTSTYEEKVYFSLDGVSVVKFVEDENENAALFYKIPDATVFARYELDFNEALESDIDSNANYEDMEDKEITIFGKTYSLVQAQNNSAEQPKLTLMAGSAFDTLLEGEEKTYNVDGVDYTVEVHSVATYSSTDKVKLVINGEMTNALADSDTDVIAGITLGVTDITYQNYAGGIHSATFFLGADKLVLEVGKTLERNSDSIEGADVYITWSESGGDISIDDININMTSQDDYYVPVGGKLSEVPELTEQELLFTQNWDLEFTGLSDQPLNDIKLVSSSDDQKWELQFVNYDGDTCKLPLVYGNATGMMFLGDKDASQLIIDKGLGGRNISKKDFFILNTAAPNVAGNDARSYVIQYYSAEDPDTSGPKVSFKNLCNDEVYERSFSNSTNSVDLKLGGKTFTFKASHWGSTANLGSNYNLTMTTAENGLFAYNGGHADEVEAAFTQQFRTKSNLLVNISGDNLNDTNTTLRPKYGQNTSIVVSVLRDDTTRIDESGEQGATEMQVKYTFVNDTTSSTKGVDSTASTRPRYAVIDPEDSAKYIGYTSYGSYYDETNPSGDPTAVFTLTVPESSMYPQVYITSGATSTATSSGGTLTAVEVVDATKLDSEVADVTMQNMIVVGGPCVNTVAAELLGSPADCTEGFTPGKARVKLFENGDYVAMLVAGYSGADTRLAGKVIANTDKVTAAGGMEVEIEGTTTADAVVGAPVVEEVVEEVVEPVVEEPVVEDPVVTE